MKIFHAFLMFAVLFSIGCKQIPTIAATQTAESGPRLKAMMKRTDVVLVKHFFGARGQKEDSGKDPDIMPGDLSFEPVWVYEPGKEKAGLKGAVVSIQESYYFIDGIMRGGKKDQATLDLDELRDLKNAIGALREGNAPWRPVVQGEDIEMQFSAKDDFSISAFHLPGKGDVLYAKAGTADVSINFDKAADLATQIDSIISLLETKP